MMGDSMISAGPASRVRWATIGKRAAQRDDYTVLADDTGGDSARRHQYTKAIADLVRSNPSSAEAGQPGSLPWAFIAPVDTDAGRRTALVVVEWPQADIRDATGRRASQTRYFDVDFAELARRDTSYLNLYDACAAMTPENGTEVYFAAEPADPAELAAAIAEFGSRRLAGIAGLMLDGDVVVMPDPALTDLPTRLRFLDAVLALLPYGIRDSVAVATWTPNDAPHGFRLAFSTRQLAGQHVVGRGLEPVLHPGAGRHYFERLVRYLDHGGEHATERLVTRLWADRREYSVHRPEEVLGALADLDQVYAVYQDLERGAASVDHVVRLLRTPGIELVAHEPAVVDRLVQEVIDKAPGTDLDVLSLHWGTPGLASMVVEATLTAPESRALGLWNVARTAGAEATFLIALVQGARDGETDRLATLLARHPVPAVPELGPELLAYPWILFRILTGAFVGGQRDWLDRWAELAFGRDETAGALPPWAEPFAAMRSGRPEMTPEQLADPTWKNPRALPALLALAGGTAGATVFLECYTAWQALFIQLRRRKPAQVHIFADVADNIGLPPPSGQAGLDLLRLAAGMQPAREQAAMDAATTAAYLDGLKHRFTKLSPEPVRQHSAELAALLVPGRLTRSGVDFLLDLALVVRQTPTLDGEEVYRRLAARAALEPEALYGLAADTIQYLVHLEPGLGTKLASRQLGDAAAKNWSPGDVIPMCLQAFRSGMTSVAILDELGAWRGLDDPATTFSLLDQLWKAAGRPNSEEQDRALRPGLAHVLEGRSGVQRARDLNAWLAHRAEVYRAHAAFLQRIIKTHKPPKQTRWPGGQSSPEKADPRDNSERSQ